MNNFLLALLSVAILGLSGCTTTPTADYPPPAADPIVLPPSSNAQITEQVKQANALFQSGKKREAAQAYYNAGINSPSPQRERLILQGVEAAALLKDVNLMEQYFLAIDTSKLNAENRARYDYGKALMAMYRNQPAIALDILPVKVGGLSTGLAGKILQARYNAARQINDPAQITTELIRQRSMGGVRLTDKDSQLIWNELNKLPTTTLDINRKRPTETYIRGWFDLAYVKKISTSDEMLSSNLANWNKNYPRHLAKSFSRKLLDGTSGTAGSPASPTTPAPSSVGKSVAVLLPFSGRLGTVANNLFQGITDAHKQLSAGTRLAKYDTSQLDATVVYNQALQQGAEFILGPFSKENITSMSRNGYLPKPALSLNYLPANTSHPDNLFQIGLLPEDEAIQVAQYATQNDRKRALVMVPESPWGQRLENAFKTAYTSRSGEIIKVVRYPNRATNYSSNVAELLSSTGSANMIFLAASPTQARLIYPAISERLQRSSRENKPVVYATSHIYSGRPSPSLDNNLNGILYTEIPYILANTQGSSHQYPRLYALGQDAFVISEKLAELQQGQSIKGKTGKIRVSSDGTLHRTLQWATFRDGVPVSLVE